MFPRLFFPTSDPASAVLASLATFGIAFLARPIGSALFGHFGDRIGRKATLVAALLTMGASTVIIGLLPTYDTIGIAAPALLALCRFGQGLGLGGEWGGAVLLAVENAPPGTPSLVRHVPATRRADRVPPFRKLVPRAVGMAHRRSVPLIRLAHSLSRQRRARGRGTLRPADDQRDPRLPAGGHARGAGQSPDARGDPRSPAHADLGHARVDRDVRPVLSHDGLRAVVGHDRPRLQPQHLPRHSTRRHRVLCAHDSAERRPRRTRTPHDVDLGHDRDRRLRPA